MAGYRGWSMSNNAVQAYEDGEKPLSKWIKTAIFEAIAEIDDTKIRFAEKMTAAELKDAFLIYSSWHHTSKMYNRTKFYCVSDVLVNEFSEDDFLKIISKRRPRMQREKSVIDAEKAAKAQRQKEKAEKIEKERLFKYQNHYKTLAGYMRSRTVDLDELRKVRNKKIAEKRSELREIWTRQGYEQGLRRIEDDDFVEIYIK